MTKFLKLELKGGMSRKHVTNVMKDKDLSKHVTQKYRDFRREFNGILIKQNPDRYNWRNKRPYLRNFAAYSGVNRNSQHLGNMGLVGSKRFNDKWGPRYAVWFYNAGITQYEKANLVFRAMLRVKGVRRRK